MKTIEVGTCESVYREVYLEVPDDLYEEILSGNIEKKHLEKLEDACLEKIEKGDYHDEDYDNYGITHILETENWNVIYE